jgi:SAM-dependent methyltransferase
VAATTWGLGDYPLMAERLEPAARRVVEATAVAAGERVLDIACGTGNAALIAAERGADAVGIDLEPALLEIARGRAATATGAEFLLGDAGALPVGDAEFDVVVSAFGVMYAPDHEAAAGELARVAKPGARIALASWTPGSFMPRMGAVLAPYLPPPPPGSGPPSLWGEEARLEAILEPAGITLETTARERLDLDANADFLIDTAGHVLAERTRLEAESRWHALRDDLERLLRENVPGEYLLATARR